MLLSKASSVLPRTGKRRAAPTVKRTGMSMLRASQNRVNQPLLTLSSNSCGGRYQGVEAGRTLSWRVRVCRSNGRPIGE